MYIPIIKTGEAEIRALEKLTPSMMEGITPIIELTRGRQKTIDSDGEKVITYPFIKRLEKVKEALKGRMVFFDLTTDTGLLSNEIYSLYDYQEGYKHWTDFINENIGESGFKKIIPSVLFNWDDENFEDNFKLQLECLSKLSNAIMYRTSLQTKDCYDELPLVMEYLPKDCQLWIVLDGGYLHESAVNLAYNRCKKRIQNIRERILGDRDARFVVAATSYPDRAYDYGDDVPIIINHSEVLLYSRLCQDFTDIEYGDYAGINPIRNDLITMARGWIPRIDIPLKEKTKVYWKRRPKGITEYQRTYIRLAEEVINDLEFPFSLREEWGISEIISCADGYVSSSAPGFWISVRMYNHIFQQLKRLER